jgi:uncharacterized protein YndB with AHSA1/START domain
MSTTTLEAIRRTVTVKAPPDRAFDVFTNRVDEWWPVETHSIAAMDEGARPESLVFEGREGGEFYEVTAGRRCHWATVVVWEPPRRFVLQWKVNPDAPAPTEIEVRFVPEGETTRVELEHRGWERLGETGPESRASYNEGWVAVLGRYEEAATGGHPRP